MVKSASWTLLRCAQSSVLDRAATLVRARGGPIAAVPVRPRSRPASAGWSAQVGRTNFGQACSAGKCGTHLFAAGSSQPRVPTDSWHGPTSDGSADSNAACAGLHLGRTWQSSCHSHSPNHANPPLWPRRDPIPWHSVVFSSTHAMWSILTVLVSPDRSKEDKHGCSAGRRGRAARLARSR